MNETDTCAVRLRGISKTYGSVRAVNNIDLEIQRGETVALLGPNGAGKSTTIGMMLGLLAPTTGTVEVFGMSPSMAIEHSHIGAMLQDGNLMAGVRVGEFLNFIRSLHPRAVPKERLIEMAGLSGLEQRRVDRLSGGQAQRVRFAMAIAGDPDLLVLDEPTAAMDVETRREFWSSMHAYTALGHTVLFATHYLEEAEAFALRLIIIAGGERIADGTVQEIQQRFGEPRVSYTLPEGVAATDVEQLTGVHECEIHGQRVTLRTRDADATTRALVRSSIPWRNLEVQTSDLEETFLKLVHQEKGKAQ